MTSDETLAPDFIRFLFSTKPKFDCYFKVGNNNQGKPEKIGAVKLMLMAHSEVFRLLLEESDLAEKKDVIPVVDVNPKTFKGMLQYVYGHDTTSELCFDEADNMLYVAEKYMMTTLKNKLAVRLMKLLNPDNICSLLNNPACYTHLELDSAITEILRYETDRVLASPQFVFMNTDGFLKILVQDGLAVPEIELWRAAIKWAKHKANSEEGSALRHHISGLTKHLRLCTLTGDQFCGEVATTDVLTMEEISAVCQSIGKKRKSECLGELSNETVPRKIVKRTVNTLTEELKLTNQIYNSTERNIEYSLTLLVKNNNIELLPLVCHAQDRREYTPENYAYKVDCTTTITKVANPDCPSTSDPPVTVTFSDYAEFDGTFEIPLVVDGKNITLLPDTKYKVNIKFNGFHKVYWSSTSDRYSSDHLVLDIDCASWGSDCYTPIRKLQYRVTTVGEPLECEVLTEKDSTM